MAGENRAERLPATTISNPKPYWEAPKVRTRDVARRIEDIIRYYWLPGPAVLNGSTNPDWSYEDIAERGPKVIDDIPDIKRDLDCAGAPSKSSSPKDHIRFYVRYERTKLDKPNSMKVDIQRAEDIYYIYLVYPSSAVDNGAVANHSLEEVQNIITAGFNGWTFKALTRNSIPTPPYIEVDSRAFPCIVADVMVLRLYPESWKIREIKVCVPYNTGREDNPSVIGKDGIPWTLNADINPSRTAQPDYDDPDYRNSFPTSE